MSWTALACTRNERPTRTAGNSPLCTNRYTVIFDTLINVATSATVRNCVPATAGFPSWDEPMDGLFADTINPHTSSTTRAAGFPSGGTDTYVLTPSLAVLVGLKRRVWR